MIFRDTNNSTFSHNDMQESDRTDEKDMSQGYRYWQLAFMIFCASPYVFRKKQ